MLRINKKGLGLFIMSLDPCWSGVRDYVLRSEEYMSELERMKSDGWPPGSYNKANINIRWLFDRMIGIARSTHKDHVRDFNDDFYGALKGCEPMNAVCRLEIHVVRLYGMYGGFSASDWSAQEQTAIGAPSNLYSKRRHWIGGELACRYGFKDFDRYIEVSEGLEYEVADLRSMTAAELSNIRLIIQPREGGE